MTVNKDTYVLHFPCKFFHVKKCHWYFMTNMKFKVFETNCHEKLILHVILIEKIINEQSKFGYHVISILVV